MKTNELYDAVVIGGGPAGSSFAGFARQKGMKVIVLEKEKFPRDHIGESLIPYTYWRLKDLGVLDKLHPFVTYKPGVNFVDIDGERQATWCFGKVLKDPSHLAIHTARSVFDKVLLDNAAELGAEVYQEHSVKEVNLDNPSGHVSVKAVDKSGNEHTIRGKFLVDATGQSSMLAKKFRIKKSYEGLDRVALYSHWVNTNYDASLQQGLIKIIYLGGEKKGWIWVIPIGKNHLSIGCTLENGYVKERKAKLEAEGHEDWVHTLYMQEIGLASVVGPIIEGAQLEHKVSHIGDYSYYCEKKYGKNYVMVGDAGAFLDPIFSSGVSVALETGQRAAHAVHTQLTQGFEIGQETFKQEYEIIDGGYKLIERFVRLFYTVEILNFSHIREGQVVTYDKFVNAYNIFHYLLAGDFFVNHKKYLDFIDTILTERSYKKFLHFIQSSYDEKDLDQNCDYTYDQMFGHLDGAQVVEIKS